jgi:hypothetical protein
VATQIKNEMANRRHLHREKVETFLRANSGLFEKIKTDAISRYFSGGVDGPLSSWIYVSRIALPEAIVEFAFQSTLGLRWRPKIVEDDADTDLGISITICADDVIRWMNEEEERKRV